MRQLELPSFFRLSHWYLLLLLIGCGSQRASRLHIAGTEDLGKSSEQQLDGSCSDMDGTAHAAADPGAAMPSPMALATRWPEVLPCREFDDFFFPYGTDGADTVEWLSPGLPASTVFHVDHGQILADERKKMPLQDIAAKRPGWLRFVHNSQALAQSFKFGLNCPDAGFVHWNCAKGTCQPKVGYPWSPDRPDSSALSSRYRQRWNCEHMCPKKGVLATLASQPLEVLRKRKAGTLVRFAQDVAADIVDFISAACAGHRCADSVGEIAAVLARFRMEQVTGPFVEEALSSEQDGLGLSAVLQASAAALPRERLFSAVRLEGYELRLECWIDAGSKGENPTCQAWLTKEQTPLLWASLGLLAGDYGWISTYPRGAIELLRDSEWQDGSARLILRGDAVRAVTTPSGKLPPVPDLPAPRSEPARTVWPSHLRCRQFKTLRWQANKQELGGADYDYFLLDAPQANSQETPVNKAAQPRELYRDLLQKKKRNILGFIWQGDGKPQRYTLSETPLDATFSPAQMSQVEPIIDQEQYKGPLHAVRLRIDLRCADPVGADIAFDCHAGACETTQSREFPQPVPVGRSYLGPGGWQCFGKCSRQKRFGALIRASRETLLGERRALLTQLARDLLSEMKQVIQIGCSTDCGADSRSAIQMAEHFLSLSSWPWTRVQLRRTTTWEPEDILGWMASAVSGKLRLQVACTRVISRNGALGNDLEDACEATLWQGSRRVASYMPKVLSGETRNGPEMLEAFEQEVDFQEGSVSIATGYDYPQRHRFDGFHYSTPDVWEKGRVKGSIRVTLPRTRPGIHP